MEEKLPGGDYDLDAGFAGGDYDLDAGFAGGDVGFTARGSTLDELFVSAWTAALNSMIERIDLVRAENRTVIELESSAADMLLFDFLQELIYLKDAEQRFYRVKEISIRERSGQAAGSGSGGTIGGYRLRAKLYGEPIDPARHRVSVDVKAVTLFNFQVRKTDKGWEATVVLDV